MTPHGVMEGIKELSGRGRALDYWHKELLLEAVEMIPTAVHFDMGSVKPLAPHVKFGNDLLSQGLFRLPFPNCFFTADCLPHTAICIGQEVDDTSLRRLHWFTCAPVQSTDGSVRSVAPSLWGELVCADGEHDMMAHGTVNWSSMTTDVHRSRKDYNRVWTAEDYQVAAEKVLSFVAGAVAVMMSADIEREIVPAPDKLNRVRVAKRRFPIGPKFSIRIVPEKQAAYRAASDAAGTHAAPELHFRRGHFRKLGFARRSDGAEVIPIAPTIVGGSADAKPIAKQYVVRA